jgi:hypothetical protein
MRRDAKTKCDPRCEPLYDIDPRTGRTIEVFFADTALARCLGIRAAGWCHWACRRECWQPTAPRGPFASRYATYRDAVGGGNRLFGKCAFFGQSPPHLRRNHR